MTLVACSGSESTDLGTNNPADAGLIVDSGLVADGGLVVDGGLLPDTGMTNPDAGPPRSEAPRAVSVAETATIPACTLFVDVANDGAADGTAARPYNSISLAVEAATDGAIICVAEGTYAENLLPGVKYFTLAGGFQSGSNFAVRSSSRYVSKAQGNGAGSFIRIEDPGPTEGQLTAVDGFEITGYSQAIYRAIYYPQRFEITNNYVHDNTCSEEMVAGSGFALDNVSGLISGNVIARNSCWRGGAGAIGDSTNTNMVIVRQNRVEANNGTEPGISHGGGFYFFGYDLVIEGNDFLGNSATGWGGGLYVGAFTGGGQQTTASLSWNVYRDNRAGGAGGGFFCDDSATCHSDHEIYERNCGSNIFLDSGPDGSDSTIATFDHLTNYQALNSDCTGPAAGVAITTANVARDAYTFANAVFWGNAADGDFNASCDPMNTCDADIQVAYSMVQTANGGEGLTVTFGAGNSVPVDPLFADPASHDFHLRSTNGRWTPNGYVNDAADSPALAAGDPAASVAGQPARAGERTELGAYGNSPEASYVR